MTPASSPLAPHPSPLPSYLVYSLGFHFFAGLLALKILMGGAGQETKIYTIDFVGNAATVVGSGGGGTPAPAPAASEKTETARPALPKTTESPDEFSTKRKGRRGKFVLPAPSLLKGYSIKPQATPSLPSLNAVSPAPQEAIAAPGEGEGAGGSGSAGSAGLSADMPNFPYPWYITQVRSLLWNRWMNRGIRVSGSAVVVFTIMPNGEAVDVRAEESSGDAAFDLAAMGAVQDAAPFPPLPQGFTEPFLRVHATLKSL